MSWVKQLFSLEERKASTIMLAFMAFVVISIYLLYKTHDMPDCLMYINLGLAGYITGYNIIPQIGNRQSMINSAITDQSYNIINPVIGNSSESGSI